MVLLNARSIRNKWVDFLAMITTTPVEIIGITETWVDTSVRDFEAEYRLPGYALFHQDRVGRAGGGVMLYVKRHLNPVQIPIVTPYEVVGAEVRGSEPLVQLFICYRPPQASPGCRSCPIRTSVDPDVGEDLRSGGGLQLPGG